MTIRHIAPLLALAVLAACTEEDYKVYDTSQKDSVFFEYRDSKQNLINSLTYNYNYDIATVHTVEIPVTLMGVPKDHDRTIPVEVIDEWTTMLPDVHYTVTDNVIPAGAVAGVVKVNLLRDRDPELTTTAYTLRLTIGENDHLRSVGNGTFDIAYSDIRPENRPSWWTTWSPLPVYSFENAQLFFEYFHRLVPEANLAFYNEMTEAYGEYFDRASNVGGPMAMYTEFIRNYVCIPLYREHPEIQWQTSPEW